MLGRARGITGKGFSRSAALWSAFFGRLANNH
ncbi:MAG: hypothetical protein ACI9OI_000188 [Chitinophagales bacterium]|jgi:hypothetical protein